MLRKRTRSHTKDQHMGLLGSEVVSDSRFHCDGLGLTHKTNCFFNVPGVFVGHNPKGLENDSLRIPTSPLDFRVFSKFGNPFRSRKSPQEGYPKNWGCRKVGLSIIDSLVDETKPERVLRASDSKNILFGKQVGIKIPNVKCCLDSSEPTKSLPINYSSFPSKQIIKNSDMHSKIGKTSLGAVSFGNADSLISNHRSNLSSGKYCLENGTSSVSVSSNTITGNPNYSSSVTKLTSFPNHDGFVGSLLPSEIELSEYYTCVKKHGPNPQTTHIYSDCVLECHGNEFSVSFKNKNHDVTVSSAASGSAIPISFSSNNFLSFCYCCAKKLEGEDIYMYRFDTSIFYFFLGFFSATQPGI